MLKVLVFAMLSSASGWGLPSGDPLLSSNESKNVAGGTDGPRDRRQMAESNAFSGWWDNMFNFKVKGKCSDSCDESCDSSCDNVWFFDNCDRDCDSDCDADCK